jgi:hypothetical protein
VEYGIKKENHDWEILKRLRNAGARRQAGIAECGIRKTLGKNLGSDLKIDTRNLADNLNTGPPHENFLLIKIKYA